jgi:L-ribulose-5-phosphate 3-epimerase
MLNYRLRMFGHCMIALTFIAWFSTPDLVKAGEETTGDAKATNILACRLANYQKFQDAAWSHLPSIGFKYVFLNVPTPDQVDALKQRLDRHGLKVAVIRGDTDLSRPGSVDELAEQLKTCKRLGVRTMFLSPKHPGVSKSIACERLRRAGDIARQNGVTIALETHPDMGTNGDEHVKTMQRINHPNVRVNFDTGNITYYNRDTDAATELKKCIDYVAAVEFKDHNGQFETWNFPTIGQGAVDFAAVMKILREHGYSGPITMEVEGVRGVEMSEAEIKEYIDRSGRHIRSLGKFE